MKKYTKYKTLKGEFLLWNKGIEQLKNGLSYWYILGKDKDYEPILVRTKKPLKFNIVKTTIDELENKKTDEIEIYIEDEDDNHLLGSIVERRER